MQAEGLITFEDFELDVARRELRRAGRPIDVEPQVFDLIAFLSANPGELLSRDDLIREVWDDRIVSDSAIASRINAARMALGDNGQIQRLIKTIPRRGFRFEGKSRVANSASTSVLTDRASVAVLPFQNLSGDPEQNYFSDGITDDIITDLSRYADLFIIARHSSFAYRNSSKTIAEIASELCVQYIVEGNIRRAGDRIRVTVRLVDPTAGNQLWAERYDRDLKDIFEVQDEITRVVVNTLVGEIAHQHYQRSLTKSAGAVNAYDHVLRAQYYVWKFDPQGHQKAIVEAERALALEPDNARAHAMISWAYLHFYSNAFSIDSSTDARKCSDAARAAVDADEREPWAHTMLGWVYQWLDRATDRALTELDRAVSLNPGSYYYRSFRAFSLAYAGQSEAALSELDRAMQLNPHYPVIYHLFYGRALFNLRRYAEAVPHLERVRSAQPNHPNALALAAACYAANGQLDDARATAREVEQANPRFTIGFASSVLPYDVDEERERFLSMLAITGLTR